MTIVCIEELVEIGIYRGSPRLEHALFKSFKLKFLARSPELLEIANLQWLKT